MYTAICKADKLGFKVGQNQKFSKADNFQSVWNEETKLLVNNP